MAACPRQLRSASVRLSVALGVVLAGLFAIPPAAAVPPAPRVVNVSGNGAWTWFQDPRVISYSGRTFVGTVTNAGAVVVRTLSHRTGRSSAATVAPAGSIGGWDDHSAPSMVITPAEQLVVFWSGHNSVDVRYRLSGRHLDLTSWTPVRHLTGSGLEFLGRRYHDGPCYTHVVYRPQDRRYYVFLRGGPHRDFYLTTSTDLLHWTRGFVVIHNDLYMLRGAPRPYTKVVADAAGRIHFAVAESNPSGAAAAVGRAGLHHLYLQGGLTGSFRHSDGSLIRSVTGVHKRPLLPRDGTTVHDDEGSDGGMARLWDVAVGDDGRPAVVYTVGRSFRWARWDPAAKAWQTSHVASSSHSSAWGIALGELKTSLVYYVSESGSVVRAASTDGATWQATTLSGTTAARRPATPAFVGYPTVGMPTPRVSSPVEVLWMQGPYTGFNHFGTWIKAYGRIG